VFDFIMAGATGLEPATSSVTGRLANIESATNPMSDSTPVPGKSGRKASVSTPIGAGVETEMPSQRGGRWSN
jgi:hypothetical protein